MEKKCVSSSNVFLHDHLNATEYDNSSVGEEEHFQIRHIKDAFTDWQVWLQIMVYFAVITPRMSHLHIRAALMNASVCSVWNIALPTVSRVATLNLSLTES